MATLFGLVLIAGGIAILAVVRPWRRDDDDGELDDATQIIPRAKPRPAPNPGPKRPSPRGTAKPAARPSAHSSDHEPMAGRRHRVEAISRARRVPPEPGREEIMLPEWLGPVSGPR